MNVEQRSTYADTQEEAEPGAGEPRLLSSTLKCIHLLEVVAGFDRPVGVADLVREVGGSRGAVHLQLTTLTHAGWLERVPGGRYRLTLRVLDIGQAALSQGGIGSWVLPVMTDLAALTDEAVSLSVVDGPDALIVWRIESTQVLRTDLRVGTRMSMAGSASGRVLAAFAEPAVLRRAVDAGARLPEAERTDAVRRQGWATSINDFEAGIAAAAAPVIDAQGRAVGALSVAGPSSRFDPTSSVAAVCQAARTLSHKLGDRQHG